MRMFVVSCCLAAFSAALVGCESKKTTEIEIPAENPYQITPDQQKAIDAAAGSGQKPPEAAP